MGPDPADPTGSTGSSLHLSISALSARHLRSSLDEVANYWVVFPVSQSISEGKSPFQDPQGLERGFFPLNERKNENRERNPTMINRERVFKRDFVMSKRESGPRR